MNSIWIKAGYVAFIIVFLVVGPYNPIKAADGIGEYFSARETASATKELTEQYKQSVVEKQEQFKTERGDNDFLKASEVLEKMMAVPNATLDEIKSVRFTPDGYKVLEDSVSLESGTAYDGFYFKFKTKKPAAVLKTIDTYNMWFESIKADALNGTVVVVVRTTEVK